MSSQALECSLLSCLCLLCKEDPLTAEEKYKTLVDKELLHIVSGYQLSDPKFIRNQENIPYCMHCLQEIDNNKHTLTECDACHYYVGHHACFRKAREQGNRMCLACGNVYQ